MQINQINSVVQKRSIKQKENQLTRSNINNTSQQSFKGIGTLGDKLAMGVATAIEEGGLFVSFTLQDMLGTNIPRPLMGLKRNAKENKGEANKKFAAKELVREMLTGPSMFIIPALMLKPAKKFLGQTINIPMKFIKSFGEIHAENPLNNLGHALTKQDFYKNTFTEIFKNAKSETNASEETLKTADYFAKQLYKAELISKRDSANLSALGKIKKVISSLGNQKSEPGITINKLAGKFTEISKKYAKDAAFTDFTQASVSPTTSASFNDTAAYMIAYANDVVVKTASQNTENIAESIKEITNNKVIKRFGTNVIMYAAIMTFLQIIPRLYNKAEGEKNAGLKGLMKEETLNDKSLDTLHGNKQETQDKIQKNQDKSKISFGSSNKFIEVLKKEYPPKVANVLTGSSILGKAAQGIEFEGCNVSFPLLLGVMGFGIIIPRTLQAKDKYDREEILRRDLVTCATMCFAEKELRKGFSKLNEAKSGLVLAAKDKNYTNKSLPKQIFDYLRPIKGVKVLSTDQIISKYSGIDKYKDGISGFCDFIIQQGGNLSKVFNLTEQSRNILNNLLEKEGYTSENASNLIVKETLKKAQDSDEVKQLMNLFKDKNNPWVKQAKLLNARFTALSVLVLVPMFLGFLLPWINEKSTKKRVIEENAQKEIEKNNSQNINSNNKNINTDLLSTPIYNRTKIFSDFIQ